MNKLFLLMMILIAGTQSHAQTPAEQLSGRIAQRMKDSLNLSSTQKEAVYAINMQLVNEKTAARTRYAGTDSLAISLQRIENRRDTLYHGVIGAEKYPLYKQKKRFLVTGN